jgi:hypothetical protein
VHAFRFAFGCLFVSIGLGGLWSGGDMLFAILLLVVGVLMLVDPAQHQTPRLAVTTGEVVSGERCRNRKE